VAGQDLTDHWSRRKLTFRRVYQLVVAAVVSAVVLFGFTTATQVYLYALIGAALLLYVSVQGTGVVRAAGQYLTAPSMRWRWAFLLWSVVSLFWTSLGGGLPLERAMTLLQIQVVGLLLFDAARNRGLFRWILQVALVAGCVGVVHALATGTTSALSLRIQGMYRNPNLLGITVVMGLIGFHAGVVVGVGRLKGLLSHLIALTLLVGVVSSSSLKAVLGAALAWLLGVCIGPHRRRAAIHLAVVAAAGLLLIGSIAPLQEYWDRTVYRTTLTATAFGSTAGVSNSLVQRTRYIRKGIDLLREAPLTGHGLDAFRWLSGEGTYSHNNYIDLGVGVGLIGVLLFYGFHVDLMRRALALGGNATLGGRFLLILVPTLLVLDVAFVSYLAKLPTLLLISAAGWIDGETERRELSVRQPL